MSRPFNIQGARQSPQKQEAVHGACGMNITGQQNASANEQTAGHGMAGSGQPLHSSTPSSHPKKAVELTVSNFHRSHDVKIAQELLEENFENSGKILRMSEKKSSEGSLMISLIMSSLEAAQLVISQLQSACISNKHILRFEVNLIYEQNSSKLSENLQQPPHSRRANPSHAMSGTLIPGSAQDSELQSLSSDAHTDDTIKGSVDGRETKVSRQYKNQQYRDMLQSASENKDQLNDIVIPQLPVKNFSPKKPEAFAALLIEKLEDVVKDDQEWKLLGEMIDKKVQNIEHEYNN